MFHNITVIYRFYFLRGDPFELVINGRLSSDSIEFMNLSNIKKNRR